MDSANQQYSSPPFGLKGDFASTGAPGSAGITQTESDSPLMSVPVSTPYASSQVPANMPSVQVGTGDTSGFSDDLPAHQSAVMPGPVGQYMSTGAGQGTGEHVPHPNAGR